MRRGLALLGAMLLLSGCAAAKEPDGLALVRVLGVDGVGPVALTAVCGGEDQEDASRGACVDETFGLARDRLPWSGREELSLTSVSHLLVGADADLKAVLFAVLEDKELGPLATVWLAEEGAAALLGSCDDPAAGLELLIRQGIEAPTAAQALAALCTDGWVMLPVVGAGELGPAWRGEQRWEDTR